MLQANHELHKLKTAHRKLFQISPYRYFFLTQRDIKLPPSESSTRETRWPWLLWQRDKSSDFWVCMRSIYIESVCLSLLTLVSNIRTGQKRNLCVYIHLLANWGLEWSEHFKKWSASAAMFFCLFTLLLLYWIRCSNPNRIPKKERSICFATFLTNTHFKRYSSPFTQKQLITNCIIAYVVWGKDKVVAYHSMTVYGWSRSKAPPIQNLHIWWR